MESILDIQKLHTRFFTENGVVEAVRGIDLFVGKGECLGIVGESGSGKSVTFLSVLRLLPGNAKIASGGIHFGGMDLSTISKKRLKEIRGGKIAMIFQDPMSSLNPLLPVGDQVAEMLWAHDKSMRQKERREKVIDLMRMVQIPESEARYGSYPHEFSGGMRQRIMIAMALSCRPDLLIADEPTTALDVSIQDQILKLIRALQRELSMSVVFITHDLGVIAELCTRVIVMYGGMIMEEAPIDELFERPLHPYTMGLLRSVPNLRHDKGARLQPIPGSPPDMLRPPAGCPFAPRCEHARQICLSSLPPYQRFGEQRRCMCWLHTPNAPTEGNPFRGFEKAQAGIPPRASEEVHA